TSPSSSSSGGDPSSSFNQHDPLLMTWKCGKNPAPKPIAQGAESSQRQKNRPRNLSESRMYASTSVPWYSEYSEITNAQFLRNRIIANKDDQSHLQASQSWTLWNSVRILPVLIK